MTKKSSTGMSVAVLVTMDQYMNVTFTQTMIYNHD